MKKIDKAIIAILAIFIFSSLSLSYADDTTVETSTGTATITVEDTSTTEDDGDIQETEDTETSSIGGEVNVNIDNLKAKVGELQKSLEQDIKLLRDYITDGVDIEEIKAKAEDLKKEYLLTVDELGIPGLKRAVEERFKIFYQNNFKKRQEIKKIVEIKKEQLKETRDELKDKAQNLRKDFRVKTKNLRKDFRVKTKNLRAKYREKFTKSLKNKISTFSTERLNTIIGRIETAIEKYSSSNLSQEIKDKFIIQLEALKELLQDQIDEEEDSINLEELFSE